MAARDEILARVRKATTHATDHPGSFDGAVMYDDPLEQFCRTLESVGGQAYHVTDRAAAHAVLESHEVYRQSAKRCTLVPGIGESTFDPGDIANPRDLHDVDFAVLPGELAVAENAAIWVGDLPQRVLYFLPQHMAIVVAADRLVDNMHQAYERLTIGSAPFGCFVSGPSKTADIEQSLVIGAHGARSLVVFMVDNLDE